MILPCDVEISVALAIGIYFYDVGLGVPLNLLQNTHRVFHTHLCHAASTIDTYRSALIPREQPYDILGRGNVGHYNIYIQLATLIARPNSGIRFTLQYTCNT